jgi:hypothetical protein
MFSLVKQAQLIEHVEGPFLQPCERRFIPAIPLPYSWIANFRVAVNHEAEPVGRGAFPALWDRSTYSIPQFPAFRQLLHSLTGNFSRPMSSMVTVDVVRYSSYP